jgi:NAD(P)-dependent dehydrogenase (short-subunit alcohol dehydrogenase family)
MELAGRHAVITGAASGIGRACAVAFAEAGAKVTVSDIDADGAQRTAQDIDGHAVQADVGSAAQIEHLIAEAENQNGRIDLFFSNAGIAGATGGPEITDDDWDLLWRVNVMSHVWAARALLPRMLERGDGYLLSTASAAGLLAQVGALGYTVTKHAALSVAEWLSITYKEQGVKVSCLCPQYVRTPMVEDGMDVEKLKAIAQIIEPEQVADAVVEAVEQERFLVLPHPEVADYMAFRGTQHDRWLDGMRALQAHLGDVAKPAQ